MADQPEVTAEQLSSLARKLTAAAVGLGDKHRRRVLTMAEQVTALSGRVAASATRGSKSRRELRALANPLMEEGKKILVMAERIARDAVEGKACPECGSTRVLPIVRGNPPAELGESAARGEIVLGGCIIYGDERDTAFECQGCKERFGRIKRESGDETK
jgi:hypothetical protein